MQVNKTLNIQLVDEIKKKQRSVLIELVLKVHMERAKE